jgi:hypothetical protein
MEREGWIEKYVRHYYKPKERFLSWQKLRQYVAENQITDDELKQFALDSERKYIIFKYPY